MLKKVTWLLPTEDSLENIDPSTYSLENLIELACDLSEGTCEVPVPTWVARPCTRGSAVCLILWERLRKGLSPATISSINQGRLIEKLRLNLLSLSADLRDSSLLCLSCVLARGFPEFCDEFMVNEGMASLYLLLQVRSEGVKYTAFSILHGFYAGRYESIMRILCSSVNFAKLLINIIPTLGSPQILVAALAKLRELYITEGEDIHTTALEILQKNDLIGVLKHSNFKDFKSSEEYAEIVILKKLLIEGK